MLAKLPVLQSQGMRGWLDETDAWHIRAEINRGRSRCARYDTGIRLGKGKQAWSRLNGVEYAVRLTHFHDATRLHADGGEFSAAGNRHEAVTCVRVVVRHESHC